MSDEKEYDTRTHCITRIHQKAITSRDDINDWGRYMLQTFRDTPFYKVYHTVGSKQHGITFVSIALQLCDQRST